MHQRLLALLFCVLCAWVASAQSKRDGAITGRVLGDDGRPVAGVEVKAHRVSVKRGSEGSAISDEEGQFHFASLAPGVYVFNLRVPGFIVEGASRGGAVYRIGEQATIHLTRGGVITGRVTDETGDPLVSVAVSPRYVRGLEEQANGSPLSDQELAMGGGGGGVTDDRGVYRIYGLPPGVYVVGIGDGIANWGDSQQLRRDAPTYYPSVSRAAAAEITLRGNEEASGIDIRHRGEPGRTLSGVIAGAVESSRPFGYVGVRLRSVEAGRFEAGTGVHNSRTFVFSGVPDGEYKLQAMRPGGDDEPGARSLPRRVSLKGADLTGIELKLLPLGSIAGRVVVEPAAKKCEPNARQSFVEEMTLRALPAEPKRGAEDIWSYSFRFGSVPNANGEFVLRDLDAGKYFITADLPDEGWYVREVTLPSAVPVAAKQPVAAGKKPAGSGVAVKSGEKVSGVEVKIAEGAASLQGKIAPAADGAKPSKRLRVHLVPAEADDPWRYAETVVGGDGAFGFQHLAPGKYWLHTEPVSEMETVHPAAWNVAERTKLRRAAETAKQEIELQPCQREAFGVRRP
ncbi:MAG: carboxypeptidase-like regulatory domain-containing protein [Blastocatellia bacterium]